MNEQQLALWHKTFVTSFNTSTHSGVKTAKIWNCKWCKCSGCHKWGQIHDRDIKYDYVCSTLCIHYCYTANFNTWKVVILAKQICFEQPKFSECNICHRKALPETEVVPLKMQVGNHKVLQILWNTALSSISMTLQAFLIKKGCARESFEHEHKVLL